MTTTTITAASHPTLHKIAIAVAYDNGLINHIEGPADRFAAIALVDVSSQEADEAEAAAKSLSEEERQLFAEGPRHETEALIAAREPGQGKNGPLSKLDDLLEQILDSMAADEDGP